MNQHDRQRPAKVETIAMITKEYRIVLPFSLDEFQIGQLWSTAEASKNFSRDGIGMDFVMNEPREDENGKSQHTHKVFDVISHVDREIRALSPTGACELAEKSWNSYPYCKTEISNPDYMKDNFKITIKTVYLPDLGTSENVHKLPPDEWVNTPVINIDMVNDRFESRYYNKETDPKLFKSEKTGRGPLGSDWIEQLKTQHAPTDGSSPKYMCAYKLVTAEFKWVLLQDSTEIRIHKQYHTLFTKFHREVFCWMDRWYGLTMEEIRKVEVDTKKELDSIP